MYRPQQFVEDRTDVLIAAIREIQFAAIVTPTADGVEVTHAPVVAREAEGELFLEMHFARANPHWRLLGSGQQSVAILQGPHAYVSPSFYPSKQDGGKVVPTWVYIAVHGYGPLEPMQEAGALERHLAQLTDANEAHRPDRWEVNDAPEQYLERMKRGIVGLRLTVERLEGAWKLNQHKGGPDRAGTADGLDRSGEAGAALAQALRSVAHQKTP